MMTSLVGQTLLKRYYLRVLIGSGGMADVYQAWDSMRSATMAVKVLRRDLSHNPQFSRLFQREAGLLKQLEHPHIVRVYEFERENDLAFITMDWVQGQSLAKLVAKIKQPFSPEQISQILQPVCSALYYAHQNQVIHCDVKPSNILIDQNSKTLLTDFGVARVAAEDHQGGTAPYMAPEQFSRGRIDGRTDVYSLGVTLFELLSGGSLPYVGNTKGAVGNSTTERIAWEHLNLPLPRIQQYNPKVSDAIATVLYTALNKQPENRFATPIDLWQAFEHARQHPDQPGGTGSTRLDLTMAGTVSVPAVPLPAPVPESPVALEPEPASRTRGFPWARKEAQLYCHFGEHSGQTFIIPAQGFRIGRSSQNDLRLSENSVSRRHAVLWVAAGKTYIRDEGSSLGTWVNDEKIRDVVLLKNGDKIQIGREQVFEYRGR
ncbi:MAG: protein kinase [Anaerolineales bacterium]|nr:protein kinase [Anaerolineales bacterium]